MTDEANVETSAYAAKPDTSREEPPESLGRIWEATVPTKETPLMDLVDLSESLRRARRPDLGGALTSLGYISLGGAIGAAVAGRPIENKWVMLSGGVGIVLILAGVLLWRKRADNVASICQRLDVHLGSIKDRAAIERLRSLYRENDPRLVARFRRWLSKHGGFRGQAS